MLRASTDSAALARTERQVRKMTRALGPVRELDVALAHLEDLGARNLVSPRALGALRGAMSRERQSRRREMLAALTPRKLERLRERLHAIGTAPEVPRSAEAIDETRVQVARRARRLATAIERAGGLYLPDRLHGVRIASKKLRYALEIDRELTRSRGTARVSQLKRLQDLLGRMHDCEILIDRTRHVQADLASSDRKLTIELDTIIRTLEAECRRDHAAYMRRRPAILKLCQALSGDPSGIGPVAVA